MNSWEEAKKRIPTQLEKILAALKDAGLDGITNVELNKISFLYNSRLSDLRRKGFVIKTDYLGKGVYKYTLIKTPSNDVLFPSAKEELFQAIAEDFSEEIDTKTLNFLLEHKGFNVIRKHGWYKHSS